MQSTGETPTTTDVNFDAAKCDEIAKRIRKLRWIGCDDEADLLALLVARVPHLSSFVATPRDTD